MPKTGQCAPTSGEYRADHHCTVFMRAGFALPPCPDCHQPVEYTIVVRPVLAPVTVECLCPGCGRGVLRFPRSPVPEGAVTFCQPHDPWNARQECLSRFRYDADGGHGWQPWPVRPKEGEAVDAWWPSPNDRVSR